MSNQRTLELNRRIQQKYPDTFRLDPKGLVCIVCDSLLKYKSLNVAQRHVTSQAHCTALRQLETKQESTVHHQESPAVEPFRDYEGESVNLDQIVLNYDDLPWSQQQSLVIQDIPLQIDPPLIYPPPPPEPMLIPSAFERHLGQMRDVARDNYIYFCIDECRDENNHLVINFLFGVLSEGQKGQSHLFSAEILVEMHPEFIRSLFEMNVRALGE